MKDSSSAAIGRMTSWNHFGTASLQNTLQGVSEPRARTRSATYIAPRARGTTPRATSPPPGGARPPHPAPHSLDDPGDGRAQEGGLEVPQHRQPPLLGRAVQAHVTQQRGRRGPGRRPAQRRRQQQPPQRSPPHLSRRGRRRARPCEPGPEPRRPPHAPEGRLRGKGQEVAARSTMVASRGESPSQPLPTRP